MRTDLVSLTLTPILLALTGCITVTPLGKNKVYSYDRMTNRDGYDWLQVANGKKPVKCEVQIFSSKEEARKGGEFEEYCLAAINPRFTFSDNAAAAIESNKVEICRCGTDKAYIRVVHPGTFWTSTKVELVGFWYTESKDAK